MAGNGPGLVGLQAADVVPGQAQAFTGVLQFLDLADRLLKITFANIPNGCLGYLADAVARMSLADGKKCDGVDIPAGGTRGRINGIADESYLSRRILRSH